MHAINSTEKVLIANKSDLSYIRNNISELESRYGREFPVTRVSARNGSDRTANTIDMCPTLCFYAGDGYLAPLTYLVGSAERRGPGALFF